MIVGFSRYSKGSADSGIKYLLNEKRAGRENAKPVLVSGNELLTSSLINSLEFKHTYSSGVLSFSPGEVISEEMEQDIIKRFEEYAFAGLEQDQYNILWVRHTHANHHELHFITPRVELSTGKSLNIKPPKSKIFDKFRDEINAKYELSDPNDPSRARDFKKPDFELKKEAVEKREKQKTKEKEKEEINNYFESLIVDDLIKSREDLIRIATEELKLVVVRQGKDYLTFLDNETGARHRMRGGIYGEKFDTLGALQREETERRSSYIKRDSNSYEHFKNKGDEAIRQRSENHYKKYKIERMESSQALSADSVLDSIGNSHRILGRDGINNIIPNAENTIIESTSKHNEVPERNSNNELSRLTMRGKRSRLWGKLHDFKGVLDGYIRQIIRDRERRIRTISGVIESVRRTYERVRKHKQGSGENRRFDEIARILNKLDDEKKSIERERKREEISTVKDNSSSVFAYSSSSSSVFDPLQERIKSLDKSLNQKKENKQENKQDSHYSNDNDYLPEI